MDADNQNETTAGVELLAIGDVHLGTQCSGLPSDLDDWGLNPEELTPAAALASAIDLAVERKVDAVLFAGDVVESTNARFEALLPFEKNVRRLVAAGIDVIAVAGNHDVEALPRIARLVDGFTLLGAGGHWQRHVIERNGQPLAEIIGWSFGDRVVRQSPVASLLSNPLDATRPGIPRIGLLHADLDASGGHYAPIKQRELDQAGLDAWLLGHIHKPSLSSATNLKGRPPSGYLGSLVGLDPSETGPHGPWLIRLDGPSVVGIAQVPMAPLRWDNITLAIDGIQDVEDVGDRLLQAAQEAARQLHKSGVEPRALGLRVRLTGASMQYAAIRRAIADGKWSLPAPPVGDTVVFINKVLDDLELPLDLVEIATGRDPAALLAQRILALQRNDESVPILLKEYRAGLNDLAGDHRWSPLNEQREALDPLDDAPLRELLLRAAKSALYAMLEQQSGGGRS
ncbi:MAG: DNA repair exonuclease [Proteobacteria bacterium]|nr:DNA repair exonuclease [Pseudomonadota bacterium]